MERLGTLWKYQEIDLLMDQHILDKKNSDSRKKLLKIRNYLVRQEENLISMDKDASQRNNLLGKLYDEYNGISGRIHTQIEKMESDEIISMEELEQLTKEGLILKDLIRRKEEELKRLSKDLDNFKKRINNIRQKVSEAKKEYIEVKKVYDAEVAAINKELAILKKQRDAVAQNIDKALMAKYKNIKASRTPVISPLTGNQCGGCFMSLASLVVQRVKDGKRIVECENCGRILYDKESIPS